MHNRRRADKAATGVTRKPSTENTGDEARDSRHSERFANAFVRSAFGRHYWDDRLEADMRRQLENSEQRRINRNKKKERETSGPAMSGPSKFLLRRSKETPASIVKWNIQTLERPMTRRTPCHYSLLTMMIIATALALPGSGRATAQRVPTECAQATGDEAIAVCTRIIADESESVHTRAIAYMMRGMHYHQLFSDYDRAIADCSEALKINPNFSGAYLCRGFAYYFKGDKARGVADMKRAAELGNPSARQALRDVGEAQ